MEVDNPVKQRAIEHGLDHTSYWMIVADRFSMYFFMPKAIFIELSGSRGQYCESIVGGSGQLTAPILLRYLEQ
jgi:hypothetical protein